MDDQDAPTHRAQEAAADSIWPPRVRGPVAIDEYGYVTVREEQDRLELRTPRGRRHVLLLIAVVYDLLVLVLPVILVYHYWHTLDPRVIIPRMGRGAAAFEWFAIKCVGGAVLVHLIILCASRIARARECVVLMPRAGLYTDGLGRKRPLNTLVEAAVTRTAGVFVVRLAPVNDRPFGAGALAPVWWISSKEAALELGGRLADYAGIPIRAAVD